MRVLFVSGEVAPFTNKTELAPLVRRLPDMLHETHGVETRILMPRYGTVSERRNRLHEVIRLSSNDIALGEVREQLNVKVASIPGIRLQVYFMDNARLFKRKGIFADRSGKLFEDNPERAAFFARSVIETIRNLGWGPDVVHAFGWISGLIPFLMSTDYSEDPLFERTKVVFTPHPVDFKAPLTTELTTRLGLEAHEKAVNADMNAIGRAFADHVILSPGMDAESGFDQFNEDEEANLELAETTYRRIQSGVAA